MFDKIEFHNTRGDVIQFNLDPDPLGYIPLHKLDFEAAGRGTARTRMESHGEWPTFVYYSSLLIHLEGHILADTVTHYNQFKLGFLEKLMPQPELILTNRLIGTLYLRFHGMTEDYSAGVTLDGGMPDIPNEALYPTAGALQLTFKSFKPYMLGETSGDYKWVA